jgi:hypothetical protein
MNPNNCAACDYSKYPHEGGHCYMFRNEPDGVCLQHTARRGVFLGGPSVTLDDVIGMLADIHSAAESKANEDAKP